MNSALLEGLNLVCPVCRGRRSPATVQPFIELVEIFEQDGPYVLQGLLQCAGPDCPAVFPIVDGVPIIVKDLARWWEDQRPHMYTAAHLAGGLRDIFSTLDQRALAHREDYQATIVYLDSHYAQPEPPASLHWLAVLQDTYWKTVTSLIDTADKPMGNSLDLGCSVGRFTVELGRVSDLAVGIDIQFSAVQRAAALQREGACTFDRQTGGGRCDSVTVAGEPAENVLYMVADALDPPFEAYAFDRVAALNLLDNVAYPTVLLGQMDALLKNGGKIILASPYEWRREITDPHEWLVDPAMAPAEVVKAILENQWGSGLGLDYAIVDEIPELPWVLRRHDRHWAIFLTHLIGARRREMAGDGYRK